MSKDVEWIIKDHRDMAERLLRASYAEANEMEDLLTAAAASCYDAADALERTSAATEDRPKAFLAWAVEIFGPIAKLRSERLLRFIEEAIELAHADGMEREVFNRVADRVYSREPGEINKEIGQAQACLETYAENIGESSAALAEKEWQRVQSIPRAEWERRHAAKAALGIALPSAPVGGAL